MKKSKTMCQGCEDDPYNHGLGGQKECFSYKDGKIISRIAIHIDQPPPYDLKSFKPTMSCYHQKRMVYCKRESFRDDGFWR